MYGYTIPAVTSVKSKLKVTSRSTPDKEPGSTIMLKLAISPSVNEVGSEKFSVNVNIPPVRKEKQLTS